MATIHPTALEALRRERNLTKAALAQASRISEKQIGRLTSGDDPKKCNQATLNKLARALGVEGEKLAESKQTVETSKSEKELGLRRITLLVDEAEVQSLRLIKDRYGVEPWMVLKTAPLNFLILAEDSLEDRRQRLKSFEDDLGAVDYTKLPHLREAIVGISRAEEAARAEDASIKASDLSGREFEDDEWSQHYSGSGDLFVDFLKRRAREVAIDLVDEVSGSLNYLKFSLFGAQLEALSNGDGLAELALRSGDVLPSEIPDELKTEKRAEERQEWLRARASEKTKERFAAEREKFADLEIKLDDHREE